jgi:eukaryotic-like serine/threonine-protein kinase
VSVVPPPTRPSSDPTTPIEKGAAHSDLTLLTAMPPPVLGPLSAARGELPPGTCAGEYTLTEAIGRGAFGTVYRGIHSVIGKEVAVKVLDNAPGKVDGIERRFVAEAQAVNRIRHPNIVDIFGFGELANGRKFCVMELLVGETLRQLTRRVGTLPWPLALEILAPLADALDAAHHAGILHRDLKPANVFLHQLRSGRSIVKLLDFGIAKNLTFVDTELTTCGNVIGTPAYMAPERWAGAPLTTACDIYSLGVIAYELLTGRRPFSASHLLELKESHVFVVPVAPSEQNPLLPRAVDQPLIAMLAKIPAARPSSAREAIAALKDALEQRPSAEVGPHSAEEQEAPTLVRPSGTLLAPAALVVEVVPSPASNARSERASAPAPRARWLRATVIAAACALTAWAAFSSDVTAAWLMRVGSMQAEGAAPLPSPPALVASSSACAAPPTPPFSPPAASDAGRIALTLEGAPPGARLYLDDALLGSVDEPTWVPRGVEAMRLRVVAKDHQPRLHKVVSDRERVVKPAPAPAKKAAPPAAEPKPRSRAARELEF